MLRLILIAGVAASFGMPAIADTGSGVGGGMNIANTTLKLPNGQILYHGTDKGHIHGAGTPFDNVAMQCQVAWIMEADFSAGNGHGTCSGINTAGDVLMWSYSGDFAGGTYRVLGGTGAYATLKGGGTYTGGDPFPDFDRFSWTFTWDSEWTGM